MREMIELAAVVAAQGPALIASATRPSPAGVEQYWLTSKYRFDHWSRALKSYGASTSGNPQKAAEDWQTIRPVLEEIFTGEILVRVWTGVLCACDRKSTEAEFAPLARSVLLGHLEARHRALALLLYGPGVGTVEAVALNRLRRRCERWTDFLLGYLLGGAEVEEFAIDSDRALDFASDLRQRQGEPQGRYAWPLMLASLRGAFVSGLSAESPHADANARVAASILGCFPPDMFDSTGVFRSLWTVRLTNAASDVHGLVEELLHEGCSPEQTSQRRPTNSPTTWITHQEHRRRRFEI